MRPLLCLTVLLASAVPALAQVSTDDRALDSLKPAAPPAPAKKPVAKTPGHAARPAHAAPARKIVVLPVVPAAPPANPVIPPPPFVMPAHKPPPPPPVPVKPDAKGEATAIPGGLQVTFGAGSSDLNPATFAALRGLAAEALGKPGEIISIAAYAPGVPDDPSTPRRLSLDRALAARAVLIKEGIVSERIRAVAKGPDGIGAGPPDRADVVQDVKAAPARQP